MSEKFKFIDWNSQKKRYDAIMAVGMVLFLLAFGWGTALCTPSITAETLIIRASGLLAITMLHLVLCIGPLSRFFPKVKMLLYNRRHLGVATFLVALIHGVMSLLQYHGGGNTYILASLFLSNTNYGSVLGFPFMVLGFSALVILGSMAATSHDYWLSRMKPKNWKRLHTLVYLAYTLTIFHVLLGSFQSEGTSGLYFTLLAGAALVCGLHIAAGLQNLRDEKNIVKKIGMDGYQHVCPFDSIMDNQAKLFTYKGNSVAVFRQGNRIQAVDNFCKHQGGPLFEGEIIDGCITCPWHGWQYQFEDGKAPPPFQEEVMVYPSRVSNGEVYVKMD